MIKIYLTRHGETQYNVEKRYCGSTDIDINEVGVKQAEGLAKKLLKGNSLDFIISSNYLRAHHTAKIVSKCINKPIKIMECFRERDLGLYEGKTKEEMISEHPDIWESEAMREFNNKSFGGESIKETQERVIEGLEEIKKMYDNKEILIVTHGFISRVINAYFTHPKTSEEFNSFSLDNCKIKEYILS